MLGETSIKVLKDIIDRTDGRIDGLLTALHASPRLSIYFSLLRSHTADSYGACPISETRTRRGSKIQLWDPLNTLCYEHRSSQGIFMGH